MFSVCKLTTSILSRQPFDLDAAVLRRLGSRMMVDLPGAQERLRQCLLQTTRFSSVYYYHLEILQHLLRDELVHPEVELATIAKRTDRYSGSDLRSERYRILCFIL